MPAGICLPKEVQEKFKQALSDGRITPEKLKSAGTDGRLKLFSDIVGEGNAKFVNREFESKLLLKNEEQGLLNWAKKHSGFDEKQRMEIQKKIKAEYQRKQKLLYGSDSPTKQLAQEGLINKFKRGEISAKELDEKISGLDYISGKDDVRNVIHDSLNRKYKVDVTEEEAKQIANMSSKLQELEAKQKPDGTFPSEDDRMAYGRAKVALGSHLAELKNNANNLSLREQAMHPIQTTTKAAGLAKALKASLDNSALFRQGWKTLATNPIIWQKNARKSFIDIYKQLGGKETLKEVQADIVSRPNYDKYAKMKLAIGTTEEEFPTTLPEKIPVFGRVYKASEGAYTGFLYRQRADVADKLLQMAEKSGVDTTDKAQLEAMGKLINSLTGRGHLGKLEGTAADSLNNLFFSARFIKSNIDTITAHQLQKGVTPFVRKQAAINLAKIIALSAGAMAIANHFMPGSAEMDPRSKNFGKIKVGHTTFDVTGGMGSLATLAAQIVSQSTKSSTTGVVSKLNSGYGSQTGMDVLNNYFENKLSPAASVIKDLIKQQDFSGNKPTLKGEASNLFTPLPISNVVGNNDPQSANKLLIGIADGLGIAANTTTPTRSTDKLSQTQQAFKDKIGDTKFQRANDEYNQHYNKLLSSSLYRNTPDAEKADFLTSSKKTIQDDIYKQYGYEKPKAKKTDKATANRNRHLILNASR